MDEVDVNLGDIETKEKAKSYINEKAWEIIKKYF